MSKIGFTEKTIGPIISDQIGKKEWAICIGAGTSLPLFPTWNELVTDLIYEVTKSIPKDDIEKLSNKFTPDSLIQAVFNRLKLNNDEYISLLSDKLFSKLKSSLTAKEWQSFRNCLGAIEPNEISDIELADFCDIVEFGRNKTSAHYIAKMVSKTIGTEYEPSAILSFNAENLLYTAISIYTMKKKRSRKKYLDFINQSISNRHKKRIPYIFCHGRLPIPDCTKRQNKRFINNQKLVFLENEYLQLANNSFSWQANTFLELITSTSVIFIGVSLTDPNMRRWLAWSQTNRLNEINIFTHNTNIDSTRHYWISKIPTNTMQKKWIEASVAHLGVRLIWIDKWDDLGTVLGKMVKM